MIEVNKNTLAGAFGILGKMICRTSPLALCKSIKFKAVEGKLRQDRRFVPAILPVELHEGDSLEIPFQPAGWSASAGNRQDESRPIFLRMPVFPRQKAVKHN